MVRDSTAQEVKMTNQLLGGNMELYISIALGIFLGEIGKRVIYQVEDWIWKFKRRNNPIRLQELLSNLDGKEVL